MNAFFSFFQYLIALQRHPDALEAKPTVWLPWNYQETLVAALAPTTR